MAIRAKLTTISDTQAGEQPSQEQAPASGRRQPTEEEKATRRERVAAAKDALKRSAGLRGDHVGPARAALKAYLQQLNEPNQPDDERFKTLVEAPFKQPPKKREGRR